MTPPCVLSIAGSDPSGGAGIQADLKTFSAFGVYGAAVPVSLTVQNTVSVTDTLMVPGAFVRAQIEAVLSDLPVSAVKIGMLGNSEIAKAVGSCLADWSGTRNPALPPLPVVCDPVMISKSGYSLLAEDAVRALEDFVLPAATVLTPNRMELEKLADPDGQGLSPVQAAQVLLERHESLRGILVKGGHIDENSRTVTDTLVLRDGNGFRRDDFSHGRFETANTHGTGCTLSSAFAALLALGKNMTEAAELAVNYVSRLIEYSAGHPLGRGHGPLFHHVIRPEGARP